MLHKQIDKLPPVNQTDSREILLKGKFCGASLEIGFTSGTRIGLSYSSGPPGSKQKK